jgi:hypothetical protein
MANPIVHMEHASCDEMGHKGAGICFPLPRTASCNVFFIYLPSSSVGTAYLGGFSVLGPIMQYAVKKSKIYIHEYTRLFRILSPLHLLKWPQQRKEEPTALPMSRRCVTFTVIAESQRSCIHGGGGLTWMNRALQMCALYGHT